MSNRMIIDEGGSIRFIYSDELQPFLSLGNPVVRRASHVEPTDDGQWTADMGPVGGPILGPFVLRGDALAAEVDHLSGLGY